MKQIHIIDLIDFKKEIVKTLEKTGCTTFATDLKQGFEKPCFFVQINPKMDYYCDSVEENIVVQINFFPASRTSIENFEMANKLRVLFVGTLDVGDRHFTIEELDIQETEGILDVTFVIRNIEEVTYSDEITMEDINVNFKEPEIISDLDINIRR